MDLKGDAINALQNMAKGWIMKKRIFTETELKEMGIPTAEAAKEAVEAGDKEKAKELINRMRGECRGLLDHYMNWVADLLDCIYVSDGEEALEEALKKTYAMREARQIELFGKTDFRGRVQLMAARLRPLLERLVIEEDDEKVCVKMEPCGTGQRLLESGAYSPPRNLSRMKPHRLTFGLPDFPIYCSHGAVQEIIAIEKIGRPIFVHWFPNEMATESCRYCVYKDPDSIPDQVYHRLGMERPKAVEEEGHSKTS